MMVALGLLPIVCLLLIVLLCARRSEHWTEGVLLGAIAWGVLVTLLTELLGAAHLISFPSLLAAWLLTAILLAVVLFRQKRGAVRAKAPGAGAGTGGSWLVAVVGVVLALTLITAIAAAPNTFDSMTYHMSRVAHWQANYSVNHYPTAILRQLHQKPWTEYAILHLQILSGGDRLANLIQWLAMAGSLAGVFAIGRRLGAGRRAALYGVVFCATIPMGILQATSTKNDFMVAFWLVCVAWLVMVLRTQEKPARIWPWLALGGALGLAALTKATAYLFAAPFLTWIALSALRSRRAGTLTGLATAGLLALSINAAFFARNVDLYGSPLGPGQEDDQHRYANELFSPGVVASNVLRNAALHAVTFSPRLNRAATRAVNRAHSAIGYDPSLPAATWMSMEFVIPHDWLHEDRAGNPLHFALLLGAFIWIAFGKDWRGRDGLSYVAAITGAFLLFCLYLKWQPWHSRLHLPLFVLGAPIVGMAISRLRWPAGRTVLLLLLIASAVPPLFRNDRRPLLAKRNVLNTPRSQQYFANWQSIADPYTEIAARIGEARCSDVGVVAGWNSYEYPLWRLLHARGLASARIRHVVVTNESARLPYYGDPAERTCAVVGLERHEAAARYAWALGLEEAPMRGSLLTLFLTPRLQPRPPMGSAE